MNELFPLAIDDVVLPGAAEPLSVRVQELAEKGLIILEPPLKEVLAAWKERENKDVRSIGFYLKRGQ